MRLELYYILFLFLPVMAYSQGIIIASNTYVIAGDGSIVLRANWANNGTFVHNNGVIVFAGTTQVIAGTSATTFNNITIATGSTTTISSTGHSLKAILLSNGTLQANGNLTLLSTAAQTALIDGSGTGEVLGNIDMQRYLPSGFGYRYFSSPFQAATVNEFSDDVNLNATFPAFYRYDENLPSSGWVRYTNTSNTLTPMQGYAANMGASSTAKTADITGVVNNHTITSATLYNHNQPYTLGFNLAGNPYPSPIDWNTASGWSRTNIDNALYYFNTGAGNQYTGTYSSYINGVSSDGIAGHVIAAMQGFFVHVSIGTFPVAATLSVNNNARLNNLLPDFHRLIPLTSPLLRLTAGFKDDVTAADPMVVYFDDNATKAFDTEMDALKLMNTDGEVPSLYVISPDAARLSICSWPGMKDSADVIQLGLKTERAGWITFNVSDLERIPYGQHIYLYDSKTGIRQDLEEHPGYRLYLNAGGYENRFFLVFRVKDPDTLPEAPTAIFNAYTAGGKLLAHIGEMRGEVCDVMITNMLGQVILRKQLYGNGYHDLGSAFRNGVYIVTFFVQQQKFSKKILISN